MTSTHHNDLTMQLSQNGNEYRRPKIRLEIDREPANDGCNICLTIFEAVGHPTHYVELTSEEAEALGKRLIEFALDVEHSNDVESEPVEDEA